MPASFLISYSLSIVEFYILHLILANMAARVGNLIILWFELQTLKLMWIGVICWPVSFPPTFNCRVLYTLPNTCKYDCQRWPHFLPLGYNFHCRYLELHIWNDNKLVKKFYLLYFLLGKLEGCLATLFHKIDNNLDTLVKMAATVGHISCPLGMVVHGKYLEWQKFKITIALGKSLI